VSTAVLDAITSPPSNRVDGVRRTVPGTVGRWANLGNSATADELSQMGVSRYADGSWPGRTHERRIRRIGVAPGGRHGADLARLGVDHPQLQVAFRRQAAQADEESDVADQGHVGCGLGHHGGLSTRDHGDDQGGEHEYHEHEEHVTTPTSGLA
jgi:hypothetical protein